MRFHLPALVASAKRSKRRIARASRARSSTFRDGQPREEHDPDLAIYRNAQDETVEVDRIEQAGLGSVNRHAQGAGVDGRSLFALYPDRLALRSNGIAPDLEEVRPIGVT